MLICKLLTKVFFLFNLIASRYRFPTLFCCTCTPGSHQRPSFCFLLPVHCTTCVWPAARQKSTLPSPPDFVSVAATFWPGDQPGDMLVPRQQDRVPGSLCVSWGGRAIVPTASYRKRHAGTHGLARREHLSQAS